MIASGLPIVNRDRLLEGACTLGDLFGQVLPLGLSLAVLAMVTAAFLALSFWIFARREYVMEQ